MINVDVDYISHGIEIVIPDVFGNHGSGQNMSLRSHKIFQQGIFGSSAECVGKFQELEA